MMQRLFSTFAAFLLSFTFLSAQTNGWESIRSNRFTEARSLFETALNRNPADEEALSGLLFIAETIQDQDLYIQTCNQLLRTHPEAPYVWLFDHMFSGRPEFFLDKGLPYALTIGGRKSIADSLFYNHRRFEESDRMLRDIFPDWQWTVIGPFTNVGGSGLLEAAPVENKPFSLQDTFVNENKQTLFWVKRHYFIPGAPVDFFETMSEGRLGNYYANTFISVPCARRVSLTLTRHHPIKIWLDGVLLFESAETAPQRAWDCESCTFNLPAGEHRLMVKMSQFPSERTSSILYFNDLYGTQYLLPDGYDEEDDRINYEYDPVFYLRLCDPATGITMQDIRSADAGAEHLAPEPWKTEVQSNGYLGYFREQAAQDPDALWKQYLLSKAFLKQEQNETGEAWFARYKSEHPESAFAKYLLAKFYDINDKGDRAEALLSEMDTIATPTFVEHLLRLDKIDAEHEEEQYIAAMEKLLRLSPTNWFLLNKYIEFLNNKGKKEEARTYVKSFLSQHKQSYWNARLSHYLEDDSYKPETYKEPDDRDRARDYRHAKRHLKKHFDFSDYQVVIDYLRQKEKTSEVLRTYETLEAIFPRSNYYPNEKASYLFEIGRNREALDILLPMADQLPYHFSFAEMIGDIYIEEKDPNAALLWYKRALALQTDAHDLEEKIQRLQQPVQLSAYFTPVDLQLLARDTNWRKNFAGAESVISYYSQQTSYDPIKESTETTRKLIIHINSEAGAKYWTEANLRPLGRITNAKVLKKDGTVTSPNMGWSVAVFKNLQPGDVILVEGTTENSLPDDIPGELLLLTVVSWPVPIAKATYDLLTPRDTPLYFSANRLQTDNFSRRDTADYKILHWEWTDIPKVESEEGAPENIDVVAWLMIGSTPDWSRVVQWYQRSTYRRTEPNYEVLDAAREILQPDMSEAESVEALHTFITSDINYSYVPFMNSNYVPKKPGITLAGKVGDCKDVATLMISMLREKNIPAWYTLVSANHFTNQMPRPTLYVFNHAIVAYQRNDGQLCFADLTTDYFPNGVLPKSDCGAWALVIRDGENQLIRLPNHLLDTAITRITVTADARLDETGTLHIGAFLRYRGVAGGHMREILHRNSPEERQKTMSASVSGGVLSHVDLENFQFDNLDDINAPLRAEIRLNSYNQLDRVQQFQILPLPLPMSLPTVKLLFAARRYSDLDLNDILEIAPVFETVQLHLPPGLELVELPAEQHIESPFGSYHLAFERLPDGVQVARSLVFHKRIIPYTDFQAFKAWYLSVLDAEETLLVLKAR